jgi:hypothetical protein
VHSDKVYRLLANGRWFSPGNPNSSTTKTGRHDIGEILLKVALKHSKKKSNRKLKFILTYTCKVFNIPQAYVTISDSGSRS